MNISYNRHLAVKNKILLQVVIASVLDLRESDEKIGIMYQRYPIKHTRYQHTHY